MKRTGVNSGAVVATTAEAEDAAFAELSRGGTAADAAIAGFFAAAGASPWPLFAPIVVALAGGGSGVIFFDGRTRQPGKGVERPLRWKRDEAPPGVRAAAPGSIAAIAAAAAIAGSKLAPLVVVGATLAKAKGANERARLLTRIGGATTRAMGDRALTDALALAAPRIDGALIGADDLVDIVPEALHGDVRGDLGRLVASAPWLTGDELPASSAERFAVLAADGRGGLAAILADPSAEYLPLFGGELALHLLAEPPRKGLTRTRPGTPLPSPAPVGALFESDSPIALVATTASRLDSRLVLAWPELTPGKGTMALTSGRPLGGRAYARVARG